MSLPSAFNYNDDSDDAPESVPLSTSKASILSQLKSEKSSSDQINRHKRDQRRAHDSLLKEQAEQRKSRISEALAQISGKITTTTTAAISKKKSNVIKPTKKIFFEDQKIEEHEEVEIKPGSKIVVLTDKKVHKKNLSAALSLKKTKDALLRLGNSTNRVNPSIVLASKRLGRPAVKFIETNQDRQKILRKFRLKTKA